ncbi:MAG TPA: carboxypeptidase regulatory-like domain-containing protein [Blastocatellia bacterium]|nr:carboxypeptidase regulatory-like domain-containing protein [Blastocatellia bacterium]
MKRIISHLLLLTVVLLAAPVGAQVPTGTITGTVVDPSGAVIQNATVTVTNKNTGASRVIQTAETGTFSAPSLVPGTYEVRVEMLGFATNVRSVEVVTGATNSVNIAMQVGTAKEIVDVQAEGTTINLESHTVQGVVTRQQIENLPLNGRSFLNLAQLEPGVTVAPGNPAQFNAQFNVSVLGGPASHTAITVDGGNIRNPVEGGTGQNFSQEVVQEFQLSSTNFDLSTGITAFGAINIVTRGGTNDYHGTGYFYFRDHNTGAYPSLKRNTITEDPFFARRQSGFSIGGPIKKDKVFFFGNFEYTNQFGVYVVQPDLPSVAGFGTLAPAPYRGKTFGFRIDDRLNEKHSGFIRYSHDGNTNAGPFGIPVPPSNFVSNKNWVDQYLLGVTSVLRPNVVNDFRFSFGYWQNRNIPAPCVGDVNGNCIGSGGPEIFYLPSVNFAVGNNFNSPQGRDLRRFPVSDNVSWQLGNHRVKFGGEWEHFSGTGYWGFFDPARAYLLSPELLLGAGVPAALFPALGLPLKINTADDLKKLPVAAFLLGIGDRAQPSFHIEKAKNNERFHLYAQDSWKVRPQLTLNYGMGWEHESNVLNYDLPKPALLAPLYGADLSPTKKEWKNFEPALGFAWSLGKSGKTVIRGGAGIFYDTQLAWWRLGERAVIGASGRQFIGNDAVTRLDGSGLPFSAAFLQGFPFAYRYGTFLAQLPALRAQQDAKFPGTGTDPQILLSKQANALGAIYPHDFPTTQAQHFNIGVQRELPWNVLLRADYVFRHMIHGTPGGFFGASVDFNHFNAIGGAAIPACTGTQANNPAAACSSGPINFWWPGATSRYQALLLKVDKRFSHRFQLTTSYAFQDSKSVLDVTQNLKNFFATYGPDLPRHNLNVSGIVDLPWKFQVSLVSQFLSHPPVAPTISGFDNTGTNSPSTAYTPLLTLLGGRYSAFLSNSELRDLVTRYNSSVAGTKTPAGTNFPTITLPANFQLGDVFSSQDIRVQKTITLHERVNLRLIGEVFNVFNVSNVANFSFNLAQPSTFGLANQRVGQTFGSGGPRAFQFAARLGF